MGLPGSTASTKACSALDRQVPTGHFDERESLVEEVDEYEAKIAPLERKMGHLTRRLTF